MHIKVIEACDMKKLFFIYSIFIFSSVVFAFASEGTVKSITAYTTFNDILAKQLFDAFETETGIAVKWITLSGSDAVARLETERTNPQAVILIGGTEFDHITAKTQGLTCAYTSCQSVYIDRKYMDTDHYWTGLYLNPLVFITNADQARILGVTPPLSWADLLQTQYRGCIRMEDPLLSKTGYCVLTTMRYICNLDEEKTFDYLRKLNKQINQYEPSDFSLYKSVVAGENLISIGFANDILHIKPQGVRLALTIPVEGTGYELCAMSLVKGLKESADAKKLYDWMLSKKAQEIIAEEKAVPVLSLVMPHKEVFSIQQINTVIQNTRWDESFQNKKRLLDRWNKDVLAKK